MNFTIKKDKIYSYVFLTLALICAFWVISLYELYFSKTAGIVISNLGSAALYKLINDFWTGLIIGIIFFPIFYAIQLFSKKAAFVAVNLIFLLLIILQFSLVKYSLTTLINLGADILGYSYDDVTSTVSASESMSLTYLLPFILFPLLFFATFLVINKYANNRKVLGVLLFFVLLFGSLKLVFSETSSELYQNKTAFLTKDIVKFQKEKNKISALNLFDREDYPLLKPFNETEDVLSTFIESGEEKPNVVVIVVEGLGAEFVADNQYSGFTPYLDSLISKSLYWDNFVSTTGRSFGILPSLFGSLPFGETGFLELTDVPSHLSLISVLKHNGYQTSYYSGGPSSFDRKVNFLEYNGVHNLIDESKYGSDFVKTKSNDGGFSWGYPDSEIFRKAISSIDVEKQPRLDIIMTLSNHEPFEFPNKEAYISRVDEMLKTSVKSSNYKERVSNHKDIFGCLLYTDESIKTFMEAYSKRPDYNNTIFIITGDHRLIPITQKDKLCRFHVPFFIYSPMLKKSEKFKSISSHWDVAPSVLSYLSNNHKLKPLEATPWIGKGLDTAKHFRNTKNIPLMRYKGSLNDMIYKDYLYANGELFKIKENFGTYKVKEDEVESVIKDSLMAFKKMNAYVTQRNKIFPDSLNIYVTPKIKFTKQQLAVIEKHSKDKTFDELLFIARDKAFNKDYKTARILCDYILNEFPNYTDAIILKGRTLAWEGVYEESEKVLLNAIQRSPYYDDAYLAILDLYWWSGQDDKSKIIFQQSIKNDVLNPDISFKMAKAYQRLEKVEQANVVIDSILKVHPDVEEYKTFKASLK
ncbi:LTA synthase family protein [Pontimicrobium aquaticum]|uniref:Sulfatase n=1 Tax=Pontimicrobium aquaticum TaxID=2565367 RepID=A0A4U0F516_9FLAO|nr:LTA synthase family protein [Pontimicrobium aquaticum]TJY37912.1 sulfatase [Pontimicrobium aquaticum]